jgi:hypothetical protein
MECLTVQLVPLSVFRKDGTPVLTADLTKYPGKKSDLKDAVRYLQQAAAAPILLQQLIAAQAECLAWRAGLNHRTNLSKTKVGATYADQSRIAAAIAQAKTVQS